MPHSLLPTLLLQILIVGYTPGPANIYSLAMSLRHGRRTSLVMWLGLLTGFSVAVCAMAVITHLVGIAFGEYVRYLKYIGAAYIIFLAWRILQSSNSAKEDSRDCTFWSGMLVQLTNAKMLLFDLKAPKWHPGLCMLIIWLIALTVLAVLSAMVFFKGAI